MKIPTRVLMTWTPDSIINATVSGDTKFFLDSSTLSFPLSLYCHLSQSLTFSLSLSLSERNSSLVVSVPFQSSKSRMSDQRGSVVQLLREGKNECMKEKEEKEKKNERREKEKKNERREKERKRIPSHNYLHPGTLHHLSSRWVRQTSSILCFLPSCKCVSHFLFKNVLSLLIQPHLSHQPRNSGTERKREKESSVLTRKKKCSYVSIMK